ncbi:hypothetical protein HMPREF9306_00424 [Propionimicrobium lymphophilum ACS-093-V-SCH5]|uniref:Uncharacterized protein n=2 Tax=Actinomycetes TaxID=1760 RepID=S2X0W8_9ACTN|nr:hypothetical protein [Propionimicrobium lymphophilum]EPD33669.1 hypothetical protein HMPREF9306_00424 [Propionimicrobium lymphophilum ACS-093-V-SCH5]
MEKIKNAAGKTICRADSRLKQIEIVHKGLRSLIWFDEQGRLCQRHVPLSERDDCCLKRRH